MDEAFKSRQDSDLPSMRQAADLEQKGLAGFPEVVFLDRDGVINEEVGIISRPEQLELVEGAAEAISRLNQAGIPVVVVTNQPVVARGWATEEEVVEIHRHLSRMLAEKGATLDGIYFCPHHENANLSAYRTRCECRKPRPGLLVEAAAALEVELSRCVMVGDRTVDLQAARKARCFSCLVLTGFGGSDHQCQVEPDWVCEDLADFVEKLFSCQIRTS